METRLEKPRQSWLRAHWKLLLVLWLGVTIAGAIAVFASIRTSDAAKLAIQTAESNPMLVERLGQPLKAGWFVSGNMEVTPASGHAELAIPISGPKGSGTIYAEERKRAGSGNWRCFSTGMTRATKGSTF
jgi:Cytochrome oxidase complex assembly protein 1